jgi:hypothetical protein
MTPAPPTRSPIAPMASGFIAGPSDQSPKSSRIVFWMPIAAS